MSLRRLLLLLAGLAGLAAALPASAVRPPDPGSVLPDFDARWSRGHRLAAAAVLANGGDTSALIAGPAAQPGELRRAARLELERALGDRVLLRWDEVTGAPRLLHAARGWLSGPDTRPAAVVAREFLLAHRELWALSEKQVLELREVQQASLGRGGALIHFAQEIDGRPVDHGHVSVAVGADGRVLAALGGGLTAAVPGRRFEARLSPAEALLGLAGIAQLPLSSAPAAERLSGDGAVFRLPGLAVGEVEVRQVVVPTVRGPRLAWRARIEPPGGLASYEVVLDDATGQALRRQNLVRYLDTRGRAFRVHPDASVHELVRFPDTEDYRTDSSPAGWVELDQTIGNNAYVQDDQAADNEDTPGQVATADPPPPGLVFDFAFTGVPANDLEQSITQLFYGINWSHDRFHQLGVDEASGAYQSSNFGRPGLEGDPVLGDALDGSGMNNANFNPQPDGTSGRMQMFIWNVDGAFKDSSNDVGVVIHEYTHGVSTRLVGGAAEVGCLGFGQGGAMGEGWSDYFAASWLGDTRIGSYLTADGEGIRNFRLDENPPAAEPDIGKDYGDYCEYPGDDQAAGACGVHANGEIWSGFLWTVREALVGLYGPTGADMADRLVVEGMKLTPCSPSMLDARDGVLLADRLLNDGAHFCLISGLAAARGYGFSASSDGTGDPDPDEAFDPWPQCVDAGTIAFTREGLEAGAAEALYSCEDGIVLAVTDGNAGVGPIEALLTSSGGDSERVALAAGPDPAVHAGAIATAAGAPVPDDGVLQVADGDTLTASYDDPDLGAPVEASAAIDCRARIRILGHRITNSTCDEDVVPGFPELPGFLDAGEAADLVIELANDMPTPLRGGVSVTTDRPDLITILPAATPLALDLPAAVGTTPGRQTLTVRAACVDDFMGATAATLQVSVLAQGFDPAATYDLGIELDRDYELQAGLVLSFDPESETAPPVGPDWETGEVEAPIGNEWTIVECSAATGSRSYRLGPADCTGEYTDEQGVPWLSPPVLDIAQPNSVAAKLVNLSFQHDVDLGAGGAFPIFDADGVVVMAVDDPMAVDFSDPFSLGDISLAYYAQLAPFGLTANTDDWEPQSIEVDPARVAADLLQPFRIVWYFVPDITPSEFRGIPVEAVAEGYYLDDVVLTYDLVNSVPSTASCTAPPTVFSVPVVAQPPGAVACGGEPVLLDASASEGLGCGVGEELDYRFLAGGAPVACFDDAAMTMARVQDADGWGTGAQCWDFPAADTTWEVEVRCRAVPDVTDLRTVAARVLDGTAILEAAPASLCGAEPLTLWAGDSAVAGCPGGLEYRFSDAAGPLDCDGDGSPDDFGPVDTCTIANPGVDVEALLEVRCAELPDCAFSEVRLVPQLLIVPVAEEQDPTASPYCPGAAVPVTGVSTMVTGCDGTVEYLWTSPLGVDTGWRTSPRVNLVLTEDEDVTLTVRCSTAPDCVETTIIPLDVREGAFDLSHVDDPAACPDAPLQLAAAELEALQCLGAPEYRFIRDGFPFDCDGDGVDDDWGPSETCDTVYVAGGGSYRVDVRCDVEPGCLISSATVRIEPVGGGPPTGDPQGTLLVAKSGDCPPGDLLLDWSDTGRDRLSFAVLRSDDPSFPAPLTDHLLAEVDGAAAHADATADCRPGPSTLVRYYTVLDRDSCTGEILPP